MRSFPLLLACTVCLVTSCRKPEPEKTLPAVRVQKLDRSAASASARYSASVEPQTRVDLAFKVGGYVGAIATRRGPVGPERILQEGDAVRKGEVLARLRTSDFEQKQGQAQAALGEALAGLEKATLDFGRASKLRVGEDITQADLDGARVGVAGARSRADGARARLAEAETALQDSILRAPLDGTVTRRALEVGALVAAGMPAFSVADTSNVKVVFGVPDTVVPRLRLGAPQTVTSEALRGRSFQGTLSRISPTADPRTRLFEIEVSLANPDAALKAGMVAALPLELQQSGSAASSILVPLSAIVRAPAHQEKYAVYVAEEAQGSAVVKAREVTLGEFMGNQIPVLSGLSSAERIVVSGASLLSDGESVRVIQ